MNGWNGAHLRRAAAAAVAMFVAVGCYSSGANLGGDAGDVADDVTGTCPAAALVGAPCTLGTPECTTAPFCQACGYLSYAVYPTTCWCGESAGGAMWMCAHADCGPMAPGTYSDPECTELRPYPDAGVDGDVDGGTVCEGSSHWELVPWPIDSTTLLSEPARFGATDRLRVEVSAPSDSCYRLGRVDVVVSPGDATDFVTISAYLWYAVGDVACTEWEYRAAWNVEIEGRQHGNFQVAVVDGNNPAGASLRYGREMCSGVPDCACGPGAPAGYGLEGSECRTDCSCAAGLSCLGYWGVGGPLWECSRGCNDFVDCAPMEQCLVPVPDGNPWVCVLGDQCDDPSPYCPDGFECLHDATDAPNRCVDRRAAPTVRPCTCDLDCGLGELCVLGPRATPSCEIPCLRNEDCPEGWLACGTTNVCVPMED
jgi:hypothetical protein